MWNSLPCESLRKLDHVADRLAPTPTVAALGNKITMTRRTPSQMLHGELFVVKGHKFYVDLLESARGAYVRISQVTMHRTSIMFPSSALPDVRDGLSRVLNTATIPEPHVMCEVQCKAPVLSGGAVAINNAQRELLMRGKRVVFERRAEGSKGYLRIREVRGYSDIRVPELADMSKGGVTIPYSAIAKVITVLREVEVAGDPSTLMPLSPSTVEKDRSQKIIAGASINRYAVLAEEE